MSIYEKSTNQLLTEYIKANLKPGQVMDKDQIVSWFKSNYPKIKSNTVNCHIIKFTTNHKTRIHYNAAPANDLLFQLPDKRLRLYSQETDPKPIYEGIAESIEFLEEATETEECADSSQFAYESHLRDFLKDNLHVIEPGLKLYRDEEDDTITGVEFDVGGRRIDILAVDKDDNFVVIELKVSKGHERVIGQILRYRGWVRKNLAGDKIIRGIIIAKIITEDLKLAASETKDIELFEYDLKMDLRKIG
jgi:RecB family endonuclease NucS